MKRSGSTHGRIAMVHYTGPLVGGEVESTMYYHACGLVERGWEVAIFAGRGEPFHPAIPFRVIPELDAQHPEVLQVRRELASGSVSPLFHQLRERLVSLLRPMLAQCDVCVVHNAMTQDKNMPLTAALYELATERTAQWVAWVHEIAWLDEFSIPVLHPGDPWDLLRTPWPHVRYVSSSRQRQQDVARLLDVPASTVGVCPPGVDIVSGFHLHGVTRSLVERFQLLEGEPLLLLPGRITRRKNMELGIRVVAALREYFPRPVLLITDPPDPHEPGNAAYVKYLRQLCSALHVEDLVLFLYERGGEDRALFLPEEVLADLHQLVDILFFPGIDDGSERAVLKAGLSRLLVFATELPALRETTRELVHFFSPKASPEYIALQIARVLEHDTAYLLRQQILRHFAWDRILEEFVQPLLAGKTMVKPSESTSMPPAQESAGTVERRTALDQRGQGTAGQEPAGHHS